MSEFQISNYKNEQVIEYSLNNSSELIDKIDLSLKTKNDVINENDINVLVNELNKVLDNVSDIIDSNSYEKKFGVLDKDTFFSKIENIIKRINNFEINKAMILLDEVLQYDITNDYRMIINEAKLKLILYNGDQAKILLQGLCDFLKNNNVKSKHLIIMNDEETRKLKTVKNEIIFNVIKLLENKDIDTSQHIRRTSRYVGILANIIKTKNKYMDICTPQYIENLVLSSLFHDIGKLIISREILCKPSRLTTEEFEYMKTHTVIGSEAILKSFDGIVDELFLNITRDVAKYHHEKWNGSGYPMRLSGEDIPLSARIVAIADVYDALSAKRCYKEAMPIDKVFALMEEWKGTHFDPYLLDEFLSERNLLKDLTELFGRL
ncbi:hypothetical protein PIROE2DRAFT_62024 [Piromyces sp. E2]|nr:hypothetical protein PIROE2DRAFT_62024 [Piromyces sp. E2]|eukprot:OUM62228.1 hypothetical protein PIROE2DRAFT_62024 [Piromyces sp. E2]